MHADGDDAGIARLVFGPAGAMPATDAQGRTALARVGAERADDAREGFAALNGRRAPRFGPAA
jgi:hypothetical protein